MSQHDVGSFRFIDGAHCPSTQPVGERATETLLEHLLDGRADVRGIADTLGFSLRELGRWMQDPQQQRSIDGLLRLEEARAQLTLGRYRVAAATMLLKVASDAQGGEPVRKACVDLLTINTGPSSTKPRTRSLDGEDAAKSAAHDAAHGAACAGAAPTEQAIVRALQELGEQRML